MNKKKRPNRQGVCRHCNKLRWIGARKLCVGCYRTPAILALYPPSRPPSTWGGRNSDPPLAAHPTPAVPGTESKIVVMENRVAAGVQCFHPADAAVRLPKGYRRRGDTSAERRGHSLYRLCGRELESAD